MNRSKSVPVTTVEKSHEKEPENVKDFVESKHPAYTWALIAGAYPIVLIAIIGIAIVFMYFFVL